MAQALSNAHTRIDKSPDEVHRKSVGSVEGVIESARKSSHISFYLHRATSGQLVRCDFPESMKEEVLEASRKRNTVVASGVISYNVLGEPLSVDVQRSLRVLRRESELPTPAEMVGLAPDLTDDLDTEEYIKGMRNP